MGVLDVGDRRGKLALVGLDCRERTLLDSALLVMNEHVAECEDEGHDPLASLLIITCGIP